jgi:uncharacterized protein YegJ (DUF2314 family)
VRLPVEDVADWAYVENGKPIGMFVERILRRGWIRPSGP